MKNSIDSKIRLSLCEIQNLQEIEQLATKNETPPLDPSLAYTGKNSDPLFLESLKRKIEGAAKDKRVSSKIQRKKEPSVFCSNLEGKEEKLKHRVMYKRGHSNDRTNYLQMACRIKCLDQITTEINKMNAVQLFEYKQKMLNQYLMLFFKQVAEECYEKSLFVSKLWETVHSIFEELIKKLLKEMNRSEKSYLTECHYTHTQYQEKFEEYRMDLESKERQIVRFKEIISKIALKHRKKCKKNKQVAYGIELMADRMSHLEKQRNQLKSQYVNMLTLGSEGGMSYSEALVYTANKFSLSQEDEQDGIYEDLDHEDSIRISRSKKDSKRKTEVKVNKVHKIKQKYILRASRIQGTEKWEDSDEEELKNLGINLDDILSRKKKKKSSRIEHDDEDSEDSIFDFHGNYKNKRIQTCPIGIVDPEKMTVKSTNFGTANKYEEGLIKDTFCQVTAPTKMIQTHSQMIQQQQQLRCQERETQWSIYDFETVQEKSQNGTQSVLASSNECISFPNQFELSSRLGLEGKLEKVIECPNQMLNSMKESSIIIKKEKQQKKPSFVANKRNKQSSYTTKRASMVVVNPSNFSIQKNRRDSNNQYSSPPAKMTQTIRTMPSNEIEQSKKQIRKTKNNFVVKQVGTTESDDEKDSEVDCEEDYEQTNMLGFIQHMSKLTPQGVHIDEAILFLLKKSIFRIKHDECNNVYQTNKKLIEKVRSQLLTMKNVKPQTLLTTKSVVKILTSVYDTVFMEISMREQAKCPAQNWRISTSTSERKCWPEVEKGELASSKEINLLELLKDSIKKQYPMYKQNQIEHKVVLITKSADYEACTNFFIKNFILLSCLQDNLFSNVVFSSDVEFYFFMLLELHLNKKEFPGKGRGKNKNTTSLVESRRIYTKEEIELSEISSKKFNGFNGNYENCSTSIYKMKQELPKFLRKFYKKQSLYLYIDKKISRALEGLSREGQSDSENLLTGRLDVFKCCHLVMEGIFSYKLDMLKSYAQIVQIEQISPNGLITEEILMDLLGFVKMTKLQKLNIINMFRYEYTKACTISGVSIIQLVRFCLDHNLPDLDQILFDTIQNYPITPEICQQIDKIQLIYKNFSKLEKICLYLHNRNKGSKNIQSNSSIGSRGEAEESDLTKRTKGSNMKDKTKMNDFWEIIGVKASLSLIHCKVVELESSQLLEFIIGNQLLHFYTANLCQFEQKKPKGSSRNSHVQSIMSPL